MLSEQHIKDIAGFMKVTPEALKLAIEAKEVKPVDGLDITKLHSFTEEELSTRIETEKATAKPELQKAAREILIKELKQQAGLEYEGKDPKTFIEKFKETTLATAKLTPSQREAELQQQISVLTSARDQALSEVSQARTNLTRANLERSLISAFPAGSAGGLDNNEKLLLFNARYEAEEIEGGGRVWKDKASGAQLRDKTTGKPLQDSDVVAGFFAEKKWTAQADPVRGGRGQGNEGGSGGTGGKPSKYSEAAKEWKSQGKNINGADFATYVSGLKKENASFEMDVAASLE